jgi:uncharacterized protein involved in copper resistance
MSRFRTTAVAVVATLTIGSAAAVVVPTAFADKPSDTTCAKQTARVDKATAKLDTLAAHFAAHPTKKNKRAEKAQVKRLAHATQRLEDCLAG